MAQAGPAHNREVTHESLRLPQKQCLIRVSLSLNGQRYQGMLLTLFFIFLLLWLLGVITIYTFGGLIHILLLFAVVVLVIRLVEGRPVT